MQYITPNWPAPSNVKAYTTLREGNLEQLALPAEPTWLTQVHGTVVVRADQVANTRPPADAAVTAIPNTICAIRTADCLPILICDRAGTQVAAIHAGWRGLAAGIVAATSKHFNNRMQDCLVWLGPAIGPTTFEVGSDVIETFAKHGWHHSALQQGFIPQANQKWFGNLYYLARVALQEQGIHADNIYGGEWCTFSDSQRFYSYRRSSDTERMVSLIWIK